jgi:tetratricopeptide (TPR) repeat protein
MKNIWVIENSVFDFFNVFFADTISILSGYPKMACNQPLRIKNKIIENSMKGFLHEELFQKNDWETKIVIRIINYLREIDLIDIEMSTWVLNKSGYSNHELVTQFKQNIYFGNINMMVTKAVTLPYWLLDSDFQELMIKFSNKIEEIIELIEAFEKMANQEKTRNIGNQIITLSREWRLVQNIRLLRCIMQKGIQKALSEDVEEILDERNPYEWLTDGFNQRIDDLIDKSRTLAPQSSIKILHSAFRYKPRTIQSCSLFFELAINYEKLQKWDEAIDAYTQMLYVAPPNGIGLFYRAKIFIKLNRFSEAKKDLETALLLPNNHIYILSEEQKNEIRTLLQKM